MYGREGESLTLALAGDAILERRLSTVESDRFDVVRDELRDADASFVNLEESLCDEEYPPAPVNHRTVQAVPTWVADELTDLGFDFFAAANNHTGDYGLAGMRSTMTALEAREVPYAGLGRTLEHARAPAYLDTGAGRVGLVAACSTFTQGSQAGPRRAGLKGRPGLAPIHVTPKYVLPEERLDDLRSLSEALGLEGIKEYGREIGFSLVDEAMGLEVETDYARGDPTPSADVDDERSVGGDGDPFVLPNPGTMEHLMFETGPDPGVYWEASEENVAAYLAAVRSAAEQADWVVASLHSHEGAAGYDLGHEVPEFVTVLARRAIEAGADAFVGHGPHLLRGIEIHEGAPIFYSLSDFVFDERCLGRGWFDDRFDRHGWLDDAEFWRSVLPVCEFADGALDRVELLPLDLGYHAPRARGGRPVFAEESVGRAVVEKLAALSEPFDTDVRTESVDGGVIGVVDLPSA